LAETWASFGTYVAIVFNPVLGPLPPTEKNRVVLTGNGPENMWVKKVKDFKSAIGLVSQTGLRLS